MATNPTTACFTGHRPNKFPWGYNETDPRCTHLKERIKTAILTATAQGYTHFIAGGALGTDTWAAEIILALREAHGLHLTIAIPCKEQDSQWGSDAKARYAAILAAADTVHNCSTEPYRPALMHERNEWMINQSSLLIAVYDGSPGGTAKAYQYAKAKGTKVFRINPREEKSPPWDSEPVKLTKSEQKLVSALTALKPERRQAILAQLG